MRVIHEMTMTQMLQRRDELVGILDTAGINDLDPDTVRDRLTAFDKEITLRQTTSNFNRGVITPVPPDKVDITNASVVTPKAPSQVEREYGEWEKTL